MGQRIVGRELRERHCRSNRRFELSCIAESACQAVMRFEIFGICGNRLAKGLCRAGCIALGQQV